MTHVVFKGRPPRITPFGDNKWPLYFITCCTLHRHAWLATPSIHEAWLAFALRGRELGLAVGRYVLMPDHLHFFARLSPERRLDLSVRGLKRALSAAAPAGRRGEWQPGFFDHLMRGHESLSEKWAYVRDNPVRAGLVREAGAWSFAGEVVPLEF